MKTRSTLSLFFFSALLFQDLAAAWQFPSLQVPLIPSWHGSSSSGTPATNNIPQFILDTKHPWLTTHADDLSRLRPDDAYSLFCDPVPAENHQPGKHGGLDLPADLFHRLRVKDSPTDIPSWTNARALLSEMKHCPRALSEVRELGVHLYPRTADWLLEELREPVLPPAGLPELFAEVLGSMKGLEKLDWGIRGWDQNQVIRAAFEEHGVRLDDVRELGVDMYASWMLDVAPNVQKLQIRRAEGATRPEDPRGYKMQVFGGLKRWRLRELDLELESWTPEMTRLLPEMLPEIEDLRFQSFERGPRAARGEALQNLTRALGSLNNLRRLHLPWSAELGLGFDGGPLCGNFYDGADGARLRRRVEMENINATERAGEIVRANVPRLKGVDVGGFYGNFTVDGEGRDVTVWPWTGRLEDWLLEIYI
ncbi:hypothetical protein CkaCkLH20_09374 [Colletotrichum karsti]|uniref:Uncharacterized protein n=1 Tax=Colletotrichum karsti TaxID=1095194 RepID=A0A9P6LHI5_9PEZI|nr:uncharacterized protein CkaCkLH20_09374 [Colletotrichum karsti]KAF9873211.1 hypothetical protein CkaCkLH20_09374 [Colletotrichum karsti]